MPLDALTIAAVRQELEEKILGGRVQGLVVPAPLSVAFEVYRAGVGRTHLLLSAHPQNARIHLLSSAPSRDPDQHPPLELLLRKYVRGGVVAAISQPRYERILELSIVKRIVPSKHQEYHSEGYFMDKDDPTDEETEAGPEIPLTQVTLIIEIMGKFSNIVLVAEDGSVMDSIKRIPSSINRYRVTLPNHAYKAPPPQDKRDPRHTTINMLSLELQTLVAADKGAAAWKGLVAGIVGVSPTLAREVAFRALGASTTSAAQIATDPEALRRLLSELLALLDRESTQDWEPTRAVGEKKGEVRILDYAPYPLLHLQAQGAELRAHTSVSRMIEEYFAGEESQGRHGALRERIRDELGILRQRDERRLRALKEQIERAQASEELRRKGETIFAYMHTLQPGQHTLVVPEENLTIELDPGLTPVENAQALFKEYHKARSAQEDLPELIEEAQMRLSLLDEIATSLDLAQGYDEIRAAQSELILAHDPLGRRQTEEPNPQKKGKKKPEKVPQPLRLKTARGVPVILGRTARQNDVATFRLASPEDLWFHARHAPGAHVILKTTAADAAPEDIEEAASLAAAYSSLRQNSQVDVIYTPKRYVRKVQNGPPGFVNYRFESVIRVAPAQRPTKGKTS